MKPFPLTPTDACAAKFRVLDVMYGVTLVVVGNEDILKGCDTDPLLVLMATMAYNGAPLNADTYTPDCGLVVVSMRVQLGRTNLDQFPMAYARLAIVV